MSTSSQQQRQVVSFPPPPVNSSGGPPTATSKTYDEDSSYDSDCNSPPPPSVVVGGGVGGAGSVFGNNVYLPSSSSSGHHRHHRQACYSSSSEGTDSHFSVSRTASSTSSTLAAEFNEYVTLDNNSSGTGGRPTESSSSTSYSTRVEFAKKLGYSEDQVKIALERLGPEPSQNELLSELIQLDGVAPGGGGGGGGGVGSGSSSSIGVGSACSSSGGSNFGSTSGGLIVEEDEQLLQGIRRHIIIDGSNVAMSHGHNSHFSCAGLTSCVNHFKSLGHTEITVFVPLHRKESSPDVMDQQVLFELESDGHLVWTPSRVVNNKRQTCYDDRFILKLAVQTDGVVVSNDCYRDLVGESPEFRKVVQERLLGFSFVGGRFTPPEDPLGRNGPSLQQFLVKSNQPPAPLCPYGRKCTYGLKCKYYHTPTTAYKSVSDNLRKQAALKTMSVPLTQHQQHINLSRTRSESASSSPSKIAEIPNPEEEPDSCPLSPKRQHKKLQRMRSVNTSSLSLSPWENLVWSDGNNEQRTKMLYHLTQIFPEYQVKHVMSLYPECEDASFICTEIVKIFR